LAGQTKTGKKEKFMARIDFSNIKRVKKNGSIHDIATATYHFFETGSEKYFQLDTYGKPTREVPEQPSQKIQFNKETAERLIGLLSREFDIKMENGSGSIPLRELDKNEAINLVNSKMNLSLNNSNTIFSNVNKGKDVWWFEPENSRFNYDFHLILNYAKKRILYYFFISKNDINPKTAFYQRRDFPNKSQVEISIYDYNFKDTKKAGNSLSFKKYLKKEIEY
jgi:hypothetical protein